MITDCRFATCLLQQPPCPTGVGVVSSQFPHSGELHSRFLSIFLYPAILFASHLLSLLLSSEFSLCFLTLSLCFHSFFAPSLSYSIISPFPWPFSHTPTLSSNSPFLLFGLASAVGRVLVIILCPPPPILSPFPRP